MTEDASPKPVAPAQSGRDCNQGLFFNTATLARFMRVCYGAEAATEVQRRVTAYSKVADFEIAEIWQRVFAHLHGVEIKGDTRRVVKSLKAKD